MLRYERYGFGGILGALFVLAVLFGVPLWFFVANQPDIPGAFLIMPGLVLLAAAIGVFVRGRRYDIECSPQALSVRVQFWFPPFQALFGKTADIPASALKAVRVNRYEGGSFHLELGVDQEVSLPRMSRVAFNSGGIRMLPRAALEDGLDHLRHIGLWEVVPMAKREKGPTVSDLYIIEADIQSKYGLDLGNA